MSKRTAQRLCEIARTVNDTVVGTHIGQLCRDMADEIEQLRDAMKGAAAAFDISASLHMEQKRKIDDLEKLAAAHRETAPLLEPGSFPLSIVGSASAILNARRKRYGLQPRAWCDVPAADRQAALNDAAAALGIER